MPKSKLTDLDFEWTSQLAYAIGLLVTDGNLSKDGRHIIMRSVDIDLLEVFRKCLNLKAKIGVASNRFYKDGFVRQPCYRVQFSDVKFYNWLVKIGITPAKSRTIGKIKIPDLYFRDFLRGHLDGDGSITGYIDRYNKYKGRIYSNNRLFVRFISASQKHIIWLRRKIKMLAGVKGALIENKSRIKNHATIWEIKFAKKESIKLLERIYYEPQVPCLTRKRVSAEKFMGLISAEKRRPYSRVIY